MNDDEVFKRFSALCYARRIAYVLIIIGVILLSGVSYSNSLTRLIVGIILIASGAIIELIYWRCPVCGKIMPFRETTEKITYCINCGKRLKP